MTSLSVSVVIPLYNHERYIAAALYSVFAQTYPPKEVIVIDDGSSDSSPLIVRAIADIRKEVVFWRHPNRGAHNTINAAIHRASGDLVAILNSDDRFHPTRLEKAVAAFTASPEVDLVATGLNFIDADDRSIENSWFDDVYRFYRECGDDGLGLVNGNFIMTTSNFVVRRKLFGEIGLMGDLRYAHDMDFLLRMVARGKRFSFIEDRLVDYRFHASNTISEGAYKVKLEWAAVVALYLSEIWSRGGDWHRATDYMAVLRKHGLTEPVLLFLAYFQKMETRSLEIATFRRDAAFDALVRGIIS